MKRASSFWFFVGSLWMSFGITLSIAVAASSHQYWQLWIALPVGAVGTALYVLALRDVRSHWKT